MTGLATIAGFGAAFPESVEQDALWEGFFRHHFATSRTAERIFARSGVRRRHTVVNLLNEDLTGWSTGQRMQRYVTEAEPLGHQAVKSALAEAGVAAEEIGLLTVVSCTGYGTPGLDIRLARSLGMPATVQRLLVGHMGCYAAIPALGAVSDFVIARRQPAVLLCLELTSLHVQPPTADSQQAVSHALFGDAATALVMLPPERTGARPALRIVDIAALTDSDSLEHMTWDVTDLGFRMGLSPRVPRVLAKHLRPMVDELLGRNGLRVDDVRGWAVHPGGPGILDTAHRKLDLAPDALRASRAVLSERGNCSSTTVLLVVDELRRSGQLADGGPVVALAFGPGLTLYAALLEADPG